MLSLPRFGRDARVNALICSGHFLSHYYQLCLPPMFIVWQQAFGVSYAELGLAMALMSGTTAVVQAPIGFLVDRYGARRFLIFGTCLMTLSIAGMGLATAYWQIALLAMLSGLGNSVIHPADYAILSGSVDASRIGRSFSIHTFVGHVGFAAAPPVTAALILLIGWRNTLLLVGLVGVPVVLSIIWQSRILIDHRGARQKTKTSLREDTRFLFSRSILSFFSVIIVW
jgi:FSR family fosmidomycin resistance protein-like MFS transporter